MSLISAVMEAYRAGNYELALLRCEALRSDTRITAPYCFFRGGFLLQLGRFAEAEQWLRQGLPLEESARAKALVYSRLAAVMLDQSRFHEAMEYFEESMRACPDRGGAYRGIAEVSLRHGTELGEVLQKARVAVRLEGANPDSIRNVNLSEALGVLAWAEAANGGDLVDVERILDNAFSLHDGKNIPMLAKLHYHAGRAYAVLQAADKAARHFQDSSRLDPQGTFGRLARNQLEQQS